MKSPILAILVLEFKSSSFTFYANLMRLSDVREHLQDVVYIKLEGRIRVLIALSQHVDKEVVLIQKLFLHRRPNHLNVMKQSQKYEQYIRNKILNIQRYR